MTIAAKSPGGTVAAKPLRRFNFGLPRLLDRHHSRFEVAVMAGHNHQVNIIPADSGDGGQRGENVDPFHRGTDKFVRINPWATCHIGFRSLPDVDRRIRCGLRQEFADPFSGDTAVVTHAGIDRVEHAGHNRGARCAQTSRRRR